MTDSSLEWTGERFLPEIGGTIALEHLHRYLMARELAKDKDVLDIACGEGYGSAILADSAHNVIGVDISDEAVAHAEGKYKNDNLSFLVGSCSKIPLPNDSIDLVVSFETIEHHDHHQDMMHEVKRVLRSDGALLISSPDKHEFTDVNQQGTHYHVKELYRNEFEKLLESFFENVDYFGQRVVYGSAIFKECGDTTIASFSEDDFEQSPDKAISRPLYLIAIASDLENPKSISGILELGSNDFKRLQNCPLETTKLHEFLHQKNLELEDRDQQLHQRNLEVQEKDQQLHQRNLEVQEKDQQLHQRNLEVQERDQQLHQRNLELEDRNQQLHQRNLELEDRDQQLHQRNLELEENINSLQKKDQMLEEKEQQLYDLLSSVAWKVSLPIRWIENILRK